MQSNSRLQPPASQAAPAAAPAPSQTAAPPLPPAPQLIHRHVADLMDMVSDVILVSDSQQRLVEVNQRAAEVYGYSPEELLQMRMAELWAPAARAESGADGGRPETESPVVFQTVHRRKDGSEFPVEVRSRRVEIGGEQFWFGVVRDITRRVQAEAERERLLAILERTPDFVGVTDLQGQVVYLNATGRRLAGFSAGPSGPPRTISDFHPAWAAKRVLQEGLPAAQREGVWVGETTVRSSTGQELPMSQVILAHKNARGEVTHFSTIMRDLTERKRIEQVLRANEERLRTIIEHSTQLHYSHTPDRVLTYVSPQAREFLDCEPEEALVSTSEFLSEHPVNAAGVAITDTALRTGVRQPPFELELRTRKGRKLWVEARESPVVLKGRTVAIVGSLTDITQRKRSEQVIRRLAQLSRDLGAATEADEAGRALAHAAQESLGWDACFLEVRTPDLKHAHYVLNFDTVNGRLVPVPAVAEDEVSPIESRVMAEGAVMILRGPGSKEMFVPFGDTSRPSASLLYVPLRHQGRYLGLFSIQRYQPQAYDRAALDLLQTLADHVSGALERLRAEQALRESEFRYRTLFDEATEGIALAEAESGRVLDCNRSFLDLVGWEKAELVGQHQRVLHPPRPEGGEFSRSFEQHRRQESGRMIEDQLLTKAGQIRTVEIKAKALELRGCKVVQGFFRDITERKQAEQALRESQRFLTKAQEVAGVGCYDFCVATGTCTSTPMLGRLFGVGADYLRDVDGWLRLVHPDERAEMQRYLQERVLQAGGRFEKEYRIIRHADGAVRWVFGLGELEFDTAGRPVRMIGTVQDITERKLAEETLRESEARFRRAISRAPFPVILHAEDGTVLEVSQAWSELSGYAPEEIPTMADWCARAYGDLAPAVLEANRRLYETDGRVAEGEFTVRTKAGGQRIWDFSSARVGQLRDGRRLVVSIASDVTARKHAEAALRELSGRLLAAQDQERRRIARELHDTTAQTIAALCVNLTLIEARLPASNPEARRLLADAAALGERAGQEIRTVSYLLHPPILEHVGLAGAIREYAAGFTRRSGVQVSVEIGAGVGRFAPEVELALLRIVQESLGNVHRHSGSPTAVIRFQVWDDEAVLEVADAGKGFRPELLAGDAEGQWGVGIAGMRERLRHLGGHLELTSSATGSVVRAVLPLRRGAQPGKN